LCRVKGRQGFVGGGVAPRVSPHRPSMTRGSPVVMIALVVVIVLGIVSAVLAVKHKARPRPAVSAVVLKDVPARVRLPTPEEQTEVFRQVDAWVAWCTDAGVKTWLTGTSRTASLHIGTMYPWETTVSFGYFVGPEGGGPPAPASASRAPSAGPAIVVRREALCPEDIELCTFGSSAGVPRQVFTPPRETHFEVRPIQVPRKLGLDVLRWPPALKDSFTARVLVEGDVPTS